MPRGRKRQVDGATTESAPTPPAEEMPVAVGFKPIDRGLLWGRLRLHASQVAELSGATLRQIIHWTDQGYLPHVPGEPRMFSGVGLDTALLLVQAREAGVSPRRAAELARRYLAAEFVLETRPKRAEPTALEVGLRALEGMARELREQVAQDVDAAEAEG